MSLCSSGRPSRRTQAQRVADSTKRLRAAALELIAKQGYQRTTLAAIGERAGYTGPMVSARYGSKSGLLESIMRTEYEDRLDAPLPAGTVGIEQVLARLHRLASIARNDETLLRAIFVLNFEALVEPDVQAHTVDWLARLAESLTSAIESGLVDGSIRPDADAERMVSNLMDSGIGLAYRWLMLPGAVDFSTEIEMLATRTERELRP